MVSLLRTKNIMTQQEMADNLRSMGFRVTQATVSRDIRELRLVKVPVPGGGSRYAMPEQGSGISDRLIRILRDSLIQVDYAGQIVVVRTLSGSAGSAAEALDSLHWEDMLGSIAGDNTIFLAARNEEAAGRIAEKISETVHGGSEGTV